MKNGPSHLFGMQERVYHVFAYSCWDNVQRHNAIAVKFVSFRPLCVEIRIEPGY